MAVIVKLEFGDELNPVQRALSDGLLYVTADAPTQKEPRLLFVGEYALAIGEGEEIMLYEILKKVHEKRK